MKLSVLDVHIGDTRVGVLFKYGSVIRLQVDPEYAHDSNRPTLSLSMKAQNPQLEASLLLNPLSQLFNSPGDGRLPSFFQNLLPEGVMRSHVARQRGCDDDDYFEILAACGGDLPGNVSVRPAVVTETLTNRLLSSGNEGFEPTLVAEPLDDGVSLSGMQPKLGLLVDGSRYTSGRRHNGLYIIGKLPTAQYDYLPEVEHLSLELARAAGVNSCISTLEPLEHISADHSYKLGSSNQFLAVQRFDRDGPGRVHAEDFAQIMNIDPQFKYQGGSYSDLGRIMLSFEGLGEEAVLELVRRIAVSELVGNYDFHLKNIGVLHHPDGRVTLSPAYDIVAYSVYMNGRGHALPFAHGLPRKEGLTPSAMRAFSSDVGMPEPILRKQVTDVCKAAAELWPDMIAASQIAPEQKTKLTEFIASRDIMQSFARRRPSMRR
jgi:serine/threonine-protein kinase HipA